MKKKPTKKKPKCPKCGSNKVIPFLYGLPTEEAFEESKRGKFIIGGCVLRDDNPDWRCSDCGHEFITGENRRLLEYLRRFDK